MLNISINVIILSVTMTEVLSANHNEVDYFKQYVIMLSVIMLSNVKLSVVLLSVVVLSCVLFC